MQNPPEHVQILVIGGGPAGSYAASALAREGMDVAVFEASKFPRYHIGESLIPSIRHYLRFIGAEDKVAQHGFRRKPGSAIKFNQYKREGYTDFVALGHDNNAWNVIRSEYDELLLNHARSSGASVYEQTRVTSVDFSSTEPARPISVTWTRTLPIQDKHDGSAASDVKSIKGTTTFDYLVDASGRAGLMSTRYLKNRKFNASLKNIAIWGYWKGTRSYGAGENTDREGAPWFEALTDESGWAWFIPLHDGTTSVGIVMGEKEFSAYSKQELVSPSPSSPASISSFASSSSASSTTPPSPSSPLASFFSRISSAIPFHSPSLPVTPPVQSSVLSGSFPFNILSYSSSPSLSQSQPTTPISESVLRSPFRHKSTLLSRYQSFLKLAPGVIDLIGDGVLVSKASPDSPSLFCSMSQGDDVDETESTVRSASDFSYAAAQYGGPGYRIIGDAGAFIDPFFSSGIHLASTSALSAAASICASIRGDCPEDEAGEWHTRRVSTSYTRFQVVVLSAYKQIRAQNVDVLSDIDEDNYDRAFTFLRPVIQGAADMGVRLSEYELQKSLDFCVNLFSPTDPAQHARVQKRLAEKKDSDASHDDVTVRALVDVSKPLLDPTMLEGIARRSSSDDDTEDDSSAGKLDIEDGNSAYAHLKNETHAASSADLEETRMVLNKINARRVVHAEYAINNLEVESLEGYVVRLERGRLGLMRIPQGDDRQRQMGSADTVFFGNQE